MTRAEYVAVAVQEVAELEGAGTVTIEVDESPEVMVAPDGSGAWVAAWVWVAADR